MRDVALLGVLGPVVETLPAPPPRRDSRPLRRWVARDPYRPLPDGAVLVDFYAPSYVRGPADEADQVVEGKKAGHHDRGAGRNA